MDFSVRIPKIGTANKINVSVTVVKRTLIMNMTD